MAIYVDHSIMGILWFLWGSPGHVFRALARISFGQGHWPHKQDEIPYRWTQRLVPEFVRLANLSSFVSSSMPEWATRGIEEVWVFLRGTWGWEDHAATVHSNNNASGQLATADQ